jgi:hypothetical protein
MEKYLRHYAEPETVALGRLVDSLPEQCRWKNVVVIPACNEKPEFLRTPPACNGRSLMILVINESVSASETISSNNQALAAAVREKFKLIWQSGPEFPGFELSLFKDPQNARDLLLVDRFNEGRKLIAKGGVGHARKIGADLACSLIHGNYIQSPWIHCSDADVLLPETYFSCSDKVPDRGCAALVYPFRHSDDQKKAESSEVVLATQLYELSLRYYVAGMKFAASPYAFHTIGSTMAVSANHYAKVRGFPKREAGEDFYLLNKLAKVGSVKQLEIGPGCEAIEIEARRSDRVPFGTGAAVNKIITFADQLNEFRFYDPAVFVLLGLWLKGLPEIWRSQTSSFTVEIFPDQQDDFDERGGREVLLAGLKELGTLKALDHAFRQSKSLHQFIRQMYTWFDAFRTLKLIHSLRDSHLPGISYAALDADQTFCDLLQNDPDLMAFHTGLRQNLSSARTGSPKEYTGL